MLQRYAVYKFAKSPDEMVDVCEELFKADIDRSEQTVKRTRRAIIFDRWVIQSEDDPSIGEVVNWCEKAGLNFIRRTLLWCQVFWRLVFASKKCDPFGLNFSIPELTWMMQTEEDESFVKSYDDIFKETNQSLKQSHP